MEQQHQSLSEQQIKAQQKTSEKQAEQPQCCPNCGTPCHSGDKFCEECGMALKELHVCVVTLLFSLIGKYALIADKGFMQNCAHSAVPRWKRMISSVLIVVILAQGLSVLTAIPLISAVFAENVIVP